MEVSELHRWDVTYHEAVLIQRGLRARLELTDKCPLRPIARITGADISYAKKSSKFFAAVLLFSFPELVLLEEASFVDKATFPYIPGLLTFREGPALLELSLIHI